MFPRAWLLLPGTPLPVFPPWSPSPRNSDELGFTLINSDQL